MTEKKHQDSVIFFLKINGIFESKSIKAYPTRISIERKSRFGFWEHRETYPIRDFGDVYIIKNRSDATVGVHRRETEEILFEVSELNHNKAEKLKDVLDSMLNLN